MHREQVDDRDDVSVRGEKYQHRPRLLLKDPSSELYKQLPVSAKANGKLEGVYQNVSILNLPQLVLQLTYIQHSIFSSDPILPCASSFPLPHFASPAYYNHPSCPALVARSECVTSSLPHSQKAEVSPPKYAGYRGATKATRVAQDGYTVHRSWAPTAQSESGW